MSYFILEFAFSKASKTLELSPIVPQKSAYRKIFWWVFSIVPVLLFKISEYSTNTQSRFASVVFDSVQVPVYLV